MIEPQQRASDPFAGEGEMRRLCREKDWSRTSLGQVASWSPALRTVVRTVMDSPFPTNLWCGDDLILIYNDAYRPVLGRKHPESLGRPGPEVWEEIWPELRQGFDRLRAGGPPLYAEEAPFRLDRGTDPETERDAARRGEPNAWFTFAVSAVRDDEGKIVALLNLVSEVTRRVRAEQARDAAWAEAERAEARLQEMFAHAPAFMAVLRGEEHVFEYVNEAYYELVGRRELLNRPAAEALPEIRGQGFEALLARVVETGEPHVGKEQPVILTRGPNGEPEERFVDFVYYPIPELDGSRSRVVAHGYDVTDHVVARRDAQEARAEAERANQAKSQFLANMSHEIRTPINAVMGYSDLLDAGIGGALTEKQREYLGRIQSSNRHLLRLINEVLDLSKIEAGEMLVERGEASAIPVARSALEMILPQAEAQGIHVEQEWECGDAAFVGDEDRTRQILLNLLSNALKFTGEGGTVTVRCRTGDSPFEEDSGGQWVAIDVEDTGSGIPEAAQREIFSPFVQGEGGHTRRTGGTGLGLTISRHLARLMDGDLTVKSAAGEGSCFTLWLRGAAVPSELPLASSWPRAEIPLPGGLARPGLAAASEAMIARANRVEWSLVDRLTGDPEIPTEGRDRAEIADHTAPLLTVMARTVGALAEEVADAALLEDSTEIRTLMAHRHGRQRQRIGWTRRQVEREYRILHDVVDSAVRRDARRRGEEDEEVVEDALGVLHHLLDLAEESSLESFERAAAEARAPQGDPASSERTAT